MSFHDVRLPVDVERGARGGPGFRTTVLPLASGQKRRNQRWSQALGGWDVGYGITNKSVFDVVLAFFYARGGRAHSFRFKDWGDFELARQVIGVTDGATATYQVYKRYVSGAYFHDRKLYLPVDGTESVWVDNVAITEGAGDSQYQLDNTTGILTLGSTLAGQTGTDVEVEMEFDVRVAFVEDDIDLTLVTDYAGAFPAIPIEVDAP